MVSSENQPAGNHNYHTNSTKELMQNKIEKNGNVAIYNY